MNIFSSSASWFMVLVLHEASDRPSSTNVYEYSQCLPCPCTRPVHHGPVDFVKIHMLLHLDIRWTSPLDRSVKLEPVDRRWPCIRDGSEPEREGDHLVTGRAVDRLAVDSRNPCLHVQALKWRFVILTRMGFFFRNCTLLSEAAEVASYIWACSFRMHYGCTSSRGIFFGSSSSR